MKKWFAAALAAIVTASFAGCGAGSGGSSQESSGGESSAPSSQASEGSGSSSAEGASENSNMPTVDKIKEKGELVMLTNAAFFPYEYMDGSEIAGVDVDIANAIAESLGVKLTITNMDFDSIVDYVKAGKGDLGIAGITANDERRQSVDFSINYVDTTQYIILPIDADETTFDPNDKVIGVQQGTTGDTAYASNEEVIKAKDIKRYKSGVDAAADLMIGRVDCVIIDEGPAKSIVANNADKLKAYDPGYEPEQYAIAMMKGNTSLQEEVNKVLQGLVDEGKIQEFIDKHNANEAANIAG